MSDGCDRKMTWDELAVENRHLKAELAVKDEAIKRARTYMDKDCWLWMGDGHDHPESLTCAVVASADQVKRWVTLSERWMDVCRKLGAPLDYDVHGAMEDLLRRTKGDRVVSISQVQGTAEDTIHFRGPLGGPKVRVEANEVPRPVFEEQLRHLLNSHCKENDSNTPDFILANYIKRCLETWAITTRERERWYGSKHEPGRGCQCDGCPSARREKVKFREKYVDGQLGQLGFGSEKKHRPTGCKKCNWSGSIPRPPEGDPPFQREYQQEIPCSHCVPRDTCMKCGKLWGEVECCCSDVLITDKLFAQGYCVKCCDGRRHDKDVKREPQ